MEETRSIGIEEKERDRFVTERMKGRKREGRRGYRDGCIGKDWAERKGTAGEEDEVEVRPPSPPL